MSAGFERTVTQAVLWWASRETAQHSRGAFRPRVASSRNPENRDPGCCWVRDYDTNTIRYDAIHYNTNATQYETI